jgi:hypothetical protein
MEIVLYVMVIPLSNVAVERHPRYIFAVKDTYVQYLVHNFVPRLFKEERSGKSRLLDKMQTNLFFFFFRK